MCQYGCEGRVNAFFSPFSFSVHSSALALACQRNDFFKISGGVVMSHRATEFSTLRTLDAVIRRHVRKAGGGAEFAKQTRVTPAQISRYGNPDYNEMMPIDVLADLAVSVGSPKIFIDLAQAMGFELVERNEQSSHKTNENILSKMPNLSQQVSELLTAVVDASRDHVLTENEIRLIEQEAADVKDAAQDIMRTVSNARGEQGGAS